MHQVPGALKHQNDGLEDPIKRTSLINHKNIKWRYIKTKEKNKWIRGEKRTNKEALY